MKFSALAVSQAKASLLPSFSFSGNSGYRFGLSENPTTGILQSTNFLSTGFSLSAGVTLFNWFSRQHAVKAEQFSEMGDKMTVKKAEDDVEINVSAAYLQVLLANEMLVIAKVQVQQTGSQAEITGKKIALGVLSELDAVQVQLQLMSDSSSLISAEERREKALLQLKALLSLDMTYSFDIEPLPLNEVSASGLDEMEIVNLSRVAFQDMPQAKQVSYQMEAAQIRIKAAKAAKYPTLTLYGSAGSNFVNISSPQNYLFVPQQATGARVNVNGTSYEVVAPSFRPINFGVTPFFRQLYQNFGQSVGLGISIPILNGKSLTVNQKREELNLEQLRLQNENLQQEFKTSVYTIFTEAVAALKKVKLNRSIVEAAAKSMEAAQKRYKLNLLSTQDLLIGHNALLKARMELLLVQYDLLFKKRLLFFYLKR